MRGLAARLVLQIRKAQKIVAQCVKLAKSRLVAQSSHLSRRSTRQRLSLPEKSVNSSSAISVVRALNSPEHQYAIVVSTL